MKKSIFIITLSLISFLSHAQKDSSQTPILDKTEHLIDKYSVKIAETFVNTIEASKPVAKEAFKTVVMLQIAKGIAYLLPIMAFIIFFVMFISEYNRIDSILKSENVPSHMNKHCGPMDEDNVTPKIVLSLIFSCIFMIMSFFCTYSGVVHLIAPKWFAIKEIIGLFK